MFKRSPLLLSALFVLFAGHAAAQTTAPVWAKPDLFWFRKTLNGADVWLKVDAEHGVKEPLFDHQRLAIEMTIRTGLEFTPTTLPFADPAMQFVVKYDGSNAYIQEGAMAIEFIHAGNVWRCDLQIKWDWNRVPPTDYECLSRRPVAPNAPPLTAANERPRISPDGRWEAFVQNGNVAIRPAGAPGGKTTPLSTDGTAADAYQPGSIRWSADSKSVAAYRVSSEVWLADNINATVKKYITKSQWAVPAH